jgi:hypothetical protein
MNYLTSLAISQIMERLILPFSVFLSPSLPFLLNPSPNDQSQTQAMSVKRDIIADFVTPLRMSFEICTFQREQK